MKLYKCKKCNLLINEEFKYFSNEEIINMLRMSIQIDYEKSTKSLIGNNNN